jgi:hypothetical protein
MGVDTCSPPGFSEPHARSVSLLTSVNVKGQFEQWLAACPIRAQYSEQLRSLMASHGQPFPLHIRKTPSHSVKGFVFQAGHASSILVTRSTGTA